MRSLFLPLAAKDRRAALRNIADCLAPALANATERSGYHTPSIYSCCADFAALRGQKMQ